MSAVCVLTPILIGSWPMIATAISAVASSLGFAVAGGREAEASQENRVETVLENSEILAGNIGDAETMTIVREGVTIEFRRDERGVCSLCVRGDRTKSALRKIGEEVAGRVTQQYAYSKLVTELKKRNYSVVDEHVQGDASIRVRVRLNG